ncbi:AsmA family protein [Dyella solisilvae]|uniref:AsmA family protein n=1 Tax=Dyella solisilvae TaxID=1920168 RepID=A0A370K5R3_9GAMM|nr:AsmA family protein [Dyella solisilvae]RDI97974.1 AsmA family protein [Dyella solisilvae]
MAWPRAGLKWYLYAPLIVVALLLAAAVVLIDTFDWNRLKPTIDARVSEAIGRPFTIQGDIDVTWAREPNQTGLASLVPWPMLEARDIAISNPDWARQPQFAQLDAVRFRLAPLALLAHRVEIPTLHLVHPRIDLERDAQGRATWDFTFPTSTQPSAWTIDLRAIGFDRGEIAVDDATGKVKLQIAVEPLERAVPYDEIVAQQSSEARQQAGRTVGAESTKALARASTNEQAQPRGTSAAYQFAWQAEGHYKGLPTKGSGKIGAVLALQETDQPFPVQAKIFVGDSHIALVGTLTDPLHLAALDIRLWFSGSSMAKLYPLLGVTLPDTPPYATEGHLQANLGRQGSHFSYQDFRGRVGGSDLAGDLVFDTSGARPKLSGKLSSHLLRFADLAPLIGADTNAEKQQRGDAVEQPADKVLPVEPFRTDRWRAMDADVSFSAGRIERSAALPINALSTHLVMDGGVLRMDPLAFDLAGGNVSSNLRLDGGKAPMQGAIQLRARHLKLTQLFPTFEPMRTSFGEINGDAALDARGNSVSALMGTSTGEVKLLMNDGAISKTLLETAGLNVANIVIGKLFGDKTVKINCAAADFAASNGLFQSRLFVLDTEDAVINVNGSIDFASEKLNLDIHPNSKGVRIISLRSPLYVKGTLKNPDVGVQPGPLILRGGGALALGVLAAPVAALLPLVATSKEQPDNTCVAVLEQMRSPSKAKPPPQVPKGRPATAH